MFATGGFVAKGSNSSTELPKYSSRSPLDRTRRPWFISLLVVVKVASSLSIFLLADFLRRIEHSSDGKEHRHKKGHHGGIFEEERLSSSNNLETTKQPRDGVGLFGQSSALIQTLAVLHLVSGLSYVFVQKPFRPNKEPLSRSKWVKLCRHSVVVVILSWIWMKGLVLTGPLRTVFVTCHYDYTLAGIISGLFIAKSGTRLRGAVLFVTGLLVLLLFDDVVAFQDGHQRPTRSAELVEASYLSKNSAGVMTLALYLVLKLGVDSWAKNLAADFGGFKRFHALSTITSAALLWIVAFLDIFAGASVIPMWSNVIHLIFIAVCGFVLNYYTDALCLKRMETWQVARVGSGANLFSAFLYSLLWISLDEVPNTATSISFTLICLGTWTLTMSERASGGGNLIGFSTDGLPLFSFSSQISGEDHSSLWNKVLLVVVSFYKQIQEDRMSRRIFYYLVLTLGFTGVEFMYGAITNSLSLITDGFHMLFDSMAIFVGLAAAVMSKWKPSSSFPFGYERIEVLSGFLNAFFLLVVSVVIFTEAWARLFSPPSVDAHQTLTISVIGLVVNLIGIYVFRNSTIDHCHVHDNSNIRGVFLHVFADTLGSIGVIMSSLMIKHFDFLIADPICSIIISGLIARTAWPLLKDTGRILLLSVPSGLERNLQQTVLQLLAVEGVKGYKSLRFWTHAPQILTGSIHIQATENGNDQYIIRSVHSLFKAIGFSHFAIQVEKDEFVARRNYVDEEDLSLRNKTLTGIDIIGIGPHENNQDAATVNSSENSSPT